MLLAREEDAIVFIPNAGITSRWKIQVLRGVGLGKVRIDIVKKTARKLMESYSDKFTMDFEENKQMVTQLLSPSTKWMRNRISGYVTTLKKTEEKRKAAMTTPAEETPVESET